MSQTLSRPNSNLAETSDFRESYANSVQVRVSVWDFQLIFGLATSESPEQVNIRNHSAIFLSPQQAKALFNVLGQNLAQYEQAFGELNLNAQPGFSFRTRQLTREPFGLVIGSKADSLISRHRALGNSSSGRPETIPLVEERLRALERMDELWRRSVNAPLGSVACTIRRAAYNPLQPAPATLFLDEAAHYPRGLGLLSHWIAYSCQYALMRIPPLPSIYLALAWKLFGFRPLVTRVATLPVALSALAAVWRICCRLTGVPMIALWTVMLTTIHPIAFAQSSLAHADIFAAAFTLWACFLPSRARRPPNPRPMIAASCFAAAALSKETAIVVPLTLAIVSLTEAMSAGTSNRKARIGEAAWLATSVLPLVAWNGWHKHKTGFLFGTRISFATTPGQSGTPAISGRVSAIDSST